MITVQVLDVNLLEEGKFSGRGTLERGVRAAGID